MFDVINSRLSIRTRLLLVSGLFASAVIFAAALLVMQARDAIEFSQKERDGLVVINTLWAATKPGAVVDASAAAEFAAPQLSADIANAANETQRLDAVLALISAVADGSNLTLDPDLDSFYAMDAVTIRIPNLLAKSRAFYAQLGSVGDPASYDMMVKVAARDMTNALSAAANSLSAAMGNNAQGLTRAALADPTDRLQKSVEALAAVGGAGNASEKMAAFEAATDEVWRTASAELDRLLAQRIDNMQSQLIQRLILIAIGFALAAAMAWIISAGLARRFRALTGVMGRMREGNFDVEIPYTGDRHETGEIAQTLKVLKDATAARAEEDERRRKEAEHGAAALFAAISRTQAVIEFNLDGTIITANENFFAMMGYSHEDLVGRHHSMLVDPLYRQSPAYRAFWEALGRGEFQAGKFSRFAKNGSEVVLQASYIAMSDSTGKPFKVIKFATDITESEKSHRAAEAERARNEREQAQVVQALATGLKSLADGVLTDRIDEPFAGKYELLRTDFNAALENLQQAMQTIGTNAGGIRSGASEISQAADDLSRRTEQQAASLEETAAALDEITATVRKTAEGAKLANNVALSTRTGAEASGEVVRQTVAAMAEIEKSSKQISQIIGVIDEIAFQTNLLALNAGVEAARAGDAGRGFAVVASEVRSLAQRSSQAAKEIKGLISASSQHVESGVKLVGEAGTSLRQIVERVAEMSGLVSEIAASAQEQSTALTEVNTAINQMDQVTQQNAAMVEQSTAASHSLNQEAEALLGLLSHFKSGIEVSAAVPKKPARKPAAHARPQPQGVMEQKRRVAQFAAAGSAPRGGEQDWEEF